MLIITSDKALRRSIKRLTTATGATASFADHEGEIDTQANYDLAIFDARKRGPSDEFFKPLKSSTRILYIIEPGSLIQAFHLFDSPMATSLFCYNDQFDDDEFISSATKALRGDVFGLQKYFPWGVTTFSMLVKSYEEKLMAIDIMMNYAQLAGVRSPVRKRIQLAADELIMNALYHAPVDEQGKQRNLGMSPKEVAGLGEVDPIEIQYGCSGRYFGISVRDGFGSLTRTKALNYLHRAGNQESTIEDKKSGAGLGLISVFKSVSKLVFNLDPHYSTEAIGLFDMEIDKKGMAGARSLHLFTAISTSENSSQPELQPTESYQVEDQSNAGIWALVGVLFVIVAALGSAYYMKTANKHKDTVAPISTTAPSSVDPSLTLVINPTDADVLLNGKPVAAGTPWSINKSFKEVKIEVRKTGYQTWKKVIQVKGLAKESTVYVDLELVDLELETSKE